MSDFAVLQAADWTEVSRRLTARVAAQAIALAAVIERHGSKDAGADRTASFLREWAGTSRPDAVLTLTRASLDHPLDRVAAHFGLSPYEVDLLLLAGLAEEHEGLAGTSGRCTRTRSRTCRPAWRRWCSPMTAWIGCSCGRC